MVDKSSEYESKGKLTQAGSILALKRSENYNKSLSAVTYLSVGSRPASRPKLKLRGKATLASYLRD